MKRQVFFSFEFVKDAWRASQVRNMGKVDGSSTYSDNDWEEVKLKNDYAIRRWIDDQMAMRSCIVVLIGTTTYTRPWIRYEIERAYELKKGIVGIYIDRLVDRFGNQTVKGANPFDYVYTKYGYRLSNYVKVFETSYITSKYAYSDIEEHIEGLIEEAIAKAGTY